MARLSDMAESIRSAKRRDRAARAVITIGGVAVIAMVFAMLILILRVSIPLFLPSTAELAHRIADAAPADAPVLACGIDDYFENGYLILEDGTIRFIALADPQRRETLELPGKPSAASRVSKLNAYAGTFYEATWETGGRSIFKVSFQPEFDAAGKRTISRKLAALRELPPADPAPLLSEARVSEDGALVRVDYDASGVFRFHKETITQPLFGDPVTEAVDAARSWDTASLGAPVILELDSAGLSAYTGTDTGGLYQWNLRDASSPVLVMPAAHLEGRITALGLVYGDVSLAVGCEDGTVTTWSPVEAPGGERRLTPIHALGDQGAAIRQIAALQRNKSLLTRDADGVVHLVHMTSERTLLTLSERGYLAAALSDRGNAIAGVTENGTFHAWRLHNPHPEASWKALFGRVWYENYPAPDYTWQSSSGTGDFEP